MKSRLSLYTLFALILLAFLPAARADETPAPAAEPATEAGVTPERIVDTMESLYGVTPGQRRNHTKGTCATGSFTGIPNSYSRSALFSGKPVPVVARFSLAGGNPNVPDATKSPRGMALEFTLPGDERQHMTMLNVPVFGAATPETFYAFLLATRPDPATGKPDPEKIKAFRASHPDSQPLADYLAKHNPPPSYANSVYYGIHTFKFIDKQGKVALVRWRYVPRDGVKDLTDGELKRAPNDFLERALLERARRGPVMWDMIITIGQPGDPETDPTVAWPAGRKEVKVGTLTLTRAMPQAGAACEGINYDPLVMADGIEPTGDPILQFRSPAYGVSFVRRSTGQ